MEKREKRTKMGKTTKIILVLAMLFCFSIFLTLVSASLYEDFEQLENRGCSITDYKDVSFSKSNLVNKFGLIEGYSSCTFVLDYAPFESEIFNLYGYSSYYGEIKQSTGGGTDYMVLLGESESALEEVVNLVANYENHKLLLRGKYVIFYMDNYFRLYEQGEDFILPPNSNCTDEPNANMYTGNKVIFGLGENITSLNSSCISENALSFPYCANDRLESTVYDCNCVVDRCVATVSEVFYWLAQLEAYRVTQSFIEDAIESWINNPEVSYISTPIPSIPPPAAAGGEEGAGGAVTLWKKTSEVSEQQVSRGYTKSLAEEERVEVEVEGESHYVGVVKVTETTVTIEVGSEPQQATLSVGEVRKFEVTDDDYYDIYVQVNSIEDGKANLTIKSIHEKIPVEEEKEEPAKRTTKSWMWLILVLIVVVVIGYLLYKRKKRF